MPWYNDIIKNCTESRSARSGPVCFRISGVVTMEEKATGLPPKEERFCLEYVIDYNGAAAARRAGYSEKSAAKQASRLLSRPEIKERVRQLQKGQRERLCISSDLVVTKTVELLDICMAKKKPIKEWNYKTHEWEDSGEFQVDSKGAARCLELLSKMLGADKAATPVDITNIACEVEAMVRNDAGTGG